jgi:subtilisin family serine protease
VGDSTAIIYATLGVAVVESEPEVIAYLTNVAGDPNGPIQFIRPELIASAINDGDFNYNGQSSPALIPAISAAYLEGYRNAVTTLAEGLMKSGHVALTTAPAAEVAWDESRVTWGLQATRAAQSSLSGRGMRIAVLDTGLDFNVVIGTNGQQRVVYHPDFKGRRIKTISFAPGVTSAKDGHGHGTHCIGTACGAFQPPSLPRYGIAHGADI